MELRNRNFSTAFKTHVFHIFSKRIFKTHFLACFHIVSQKCEKWENMRKKCVLTMRLEKMWKKCVLKMHLEKTWKKNVKNVKKTHLNIQLGRWNFDFLGSSFAAVTLLPANFCRLKIGEEQFKSIGSGLCKSQICSIYLYKSNDYQEQKHKIKCRRKRNKASKLL